MKHFYRHSFLRSFLLIGFALFVFPGIVSADVVNEYWPSHNGNYNFSVTITDPDDRELIVWEGTYPLVGIASDYDWWEYIPNPENCCGWSSDVLGDVLWSVTSGNASISNPDVLSTNFTLNNNDRGVWVGFELTVDDLPSPLSEYDTGNRNDPAQSAVSTIAFLGGIFTVSTSGELEGQTNMKGNSLEFPYSHRIGFSTTTKGFTNNMNSADNEVYNSPYGTCSAWGKNAEIIFTLQPYGMYNYLSTSEADSRLTLKQYVTGESWYKENGSDVEHPYYDNGQYSPWTNVADNPGLDWLSHSWYFASSRLRRSFVDGPGIGTGISNNANIGTRTQLYMSVMFRLEAWWDDRKIRDNVYWYRNLNLEHHPSLQEWNPTTNN